MKAFSSVIAVTQFIERSVQESQRATSHLIGIGYDTCPLWRTFTRATDTVKARWNGWNRNAEVYQNACIWISIVGNIWQAAMVIQQRLIGLLKIVLLIFRLLEYLTYTTSSCADTIVPYDFMLVSAIDVGEEAGTAEAKTVTFC